MSNIFVKFDVFSELDEKFKENIQLFHVFDDKWNKKCVFIVTKDDKVFSFGSNYNGMCGFGLANGTDTPKELPELCGKQIKNFSIGLVFVLALNQQNQVFSWGLNLNGELGRGYQSNEYSKPDIIPELENIIEISCGSVHSLALDSKGYVYGWGHNDGGQVGCGQQIGTTIDKPYQLKSLENIKSIHCSDCKSFAVTLNGLLYSWGKNLDYCLANNSSDPIFEPKLIIDLNNILSVNCSHQNTYFLTTDGNVYFCGQIESQSNLLEFQEIPRILKTQLKFQTLQTMSSSKKGLVLGLSEETIYCFEKSEIKKTEYKSFIDYCLNELEITTQTLPKQVPIEYMKLGKGYFGTVYRWLDQTDRQEYALKIMSDPVGKISEYLAEVKALSKCDERYVVKYFDSWIKDDLFYIKMELCDNNLENIIELKKICFKRQSTDEMTIIEYFICFQLTKEIVECVQYLHHFKPNPIIHRDLKPQNILVNYQQNSQRFLKLCDFGLATTATDITMSHTKGVGTVKYMAPEVTFSGENDFRVRYTTKADIFSLGVILCELFDFDINSSKLKTNMEILIEQMLNSQYRDRPDCDSILNQLKSININLLEYFQTETTKENIRQMSEFSNCFFINYFQDNLSCTDCELCIQLGLFDKKIPFDSQSLSNSETDINEDIFEDNNISDYDLDFNSSNSDSDSSDAEETDIIDYNNTEKFYGKTFDWILEKLLPQLFAGKLKQNSFYYSRDNSVLILTSDDQLYGFGNNEYGKCGFGHHKKVDSPQKLPELCGIQINEIFIGGKFVLAINQQNKVFSWGHNDFGQLGRGYSSPEFEYLKPEIIAGLENVLEISCGNNHCLALDSEGFVFGWGCNERGQVGFPNVNCLTEPTKLKLLPKIKQIYCFDSVSFVLTFDGQVYIFGYIYSYGLDQLSMNNVFEPKLITDLKNITSIGFSASSYRDTAYFLNNNGNVYFYGYDWSSREYQGIPKLLETDLKFKSLKTINSSPLALNEETVYCLVKNKFKKTKFKTLEGYLSEENQFKLAYQFKHTLLKSINRYEELSDLGSGGFGTVIKAKDKIDDNIYSIKIMDVNSFDEMSPFLVYQKEVQLLAKCSEQYVVKYYDSWIEKRQFFIKMELCSNNLKYIIKKKDKCFKRQSINELSVIEYFISCQLIKEILECLQYIHDLNPPIIHRDIKPENILVNYEPVNRRFLKLCDFGLATFGDDHTISHTRGMGTTRYMAPEVYDGVEGKNSLRMKYSTKADVYSLGIILCELFGFDINSIDMNFVKNKHLVRNWNEMVEKTRNMLELKYQDRPNCEELLSTFKNWAIETIVETEIESEEYKKNLIQIKEFKNTFLYNYFNEKLKKL